MSLQGCCQLMRALKIAQAKMEAPKVVYNRDPLVRKYSTAYVNMRTLVPGICKHTKQNLSLPRTQNLEYFFKFLNLMV